MTKNAGARAPLVSVVTVTRNVAECLPGCLASVAAQEGVEHEHWVVDGASTDGTTALLRRSRDSRLHWISEPDQGIYDAMNKAVTRASGKWILFLGADDRLHPGILNHMSSRLVENHTVYYGDVWMTGSKRRYGGKYGGWKLALKNICQQALFYPRSVFDAHSFNPAYAIQADWVLNMACWHDRRFRFEYVPVVVADFNDVTGASSRRRDLAIERDYIQLLNQHFPAHVAWPLSAAVVAWRLLKRKEGP